MTLLALHRRSRMVPVRFPLAFKFFRATAEGSLGIVWMLRYSGVDLASVFALRSAGSPCGS